MIAVETLKFALFFFPTLLILYCVIGKILKYLAWNHGKFTKHDGTILDIL